MAPVAAQGTKAAPPKPATAKAVFAGGCFWCVEEAFDKVPGVIATTSGYTGGRTKNPTYEQVSSESTGHAEAVLVEYDPSKVTYQKLVDVLWRNIDPTQRNGQFCDHGSSYRSAIFYLDDEQRRIAEASKSELVKDKPFRGEIVTEVTKASDFYPAEGYHQDYYQRNPIRYKFYKTGCGREARLKQLWERSGG
ncbi:MAG: peptide-methionine (S)-S-oxide reductase MsrA [Betaproteobacteria bacterium]|nr:peptide-methionine (S)-S-oxide reductase MsrA [Betaproteobacteria bacterium]